MVSCLNQLRNKRRTDESRSPGHKDTHDVVSFSPTDTRPISRGQSGPSITRWLSACGRSILKVRMIGPIVLPHQNRETQRSEASALPPSVGSSQRMDPLSEVLALMKPQIYVSGGFAVPGEMAIQFPQHQGIKCYAMLAGQCWLAVEGVPEPVLLHAG